MALLTTFATTPLATLLYPPWYQEKLKAWRRGEIDWDTGAPSQDHTSTDESKPPKPNTDRIRRLLVYLTLDNMPSILDLVSMFGMTSTQASQSHPADRDESKSNSVLTTVRAHGIRLLQLTDRDSSVMTVSQVDDYSQADPVVNIFRTLGQLHKLAVSGEVAVMPETRFAEALISKSSAISSDLVLVPWDNSPQLTSSADNLSSKLGTSYAAVIRPVLLNPEHNLAIFFPRPLSLNIAAESSNTPTRTKLMRTYSFSDIKHDLPAITSVATLSHHLFVPYFGGSDDQLALTLALQLCERPDVTATVVFFPVTPSSTDAFFSSVQTQSVGSRIKLEKAPATGSDDAFEASLDRAVTELQPEEPNKNARWHNLILLGRRANADTHGTISGKATHTVAEEVKEGLGAVAAHFVSSGVKADLLVVQARG